MNKGKTISILFILSLFLQNGCVGLFDKEISGQKTFPEMFESIEELESYVIGLYSLIKRSELFSRDILAILDIRSDDVKSNNNATSLLQFANFSVPPNSATVKSLWRNLYQVVQQSNAIINTPTEFNENNVGDQFLGEAFVIRGLTYFYLVNLFSQLPNFSPLSDHDGVPLILEFNNNFLRPRSSVNEVYLQIKSDLIVSLDLLESEQRTERINRWAALALLSRVNLYLEEYDEALIHTSEVISDSPYKLIRPEIYYDFWRTGVVPDAIFEIVNTVIDPPGINNLAQLYTSRGSGEYLPSSALVDTISQSDIRSIFFRNDPNLEVGFGNRRIDKYTNTTGKDNIPILRLTEMYLIRAEANYYLGNEVQAKSDLLIIQKRAEDLKNDIEGEGEHLLNLILLERRKEMAFEGLRFWDILRNKQNLIRQDCTSDVCALEYPNHKFVLPIPRSEIDLNPLLTQNPGY